MKRIALLALALAACDGACGKTPSAAGPDAASAAPTAPARTPAQIRAEGNHLAGSASLYLQQHAHNPVDWYPWGPEALDLARAQGKPIFLSIGYASCHWCHVMEEEVFSKDDVALLLNQRFVAIKVDREERPDVDALFVDAVVSMTGSAGWPLTVLLTPSQFPFFGATYIPHDAFLAAMTRGADELARSPADVESRAREIFERIAKAPEASAASGRVRSDEVIAIAGRAVELADPAWGGFRGRQKFPNPVRWRMILHAYRKSGDKALGDALKKTLDALATGGIRDHVGGGFHRYAVDPEWAVPHFEKMLYVNAELADLFLEAGAAMDPAYVEVATDTLDFLLRDMKNASGTFAASLDADSPGDGASPVSPGAPSTQGEGCYYTWTREELAAAAGEADAKTLRGGDFDERLVLARRPPRDDKAWARARPKLQAARALRPGPRRDAKAITSWNALALGALAKAYAKTGEARFRDAAESAASRLWHAHRTGAGLARALNGDAAAMPGSLDDYATLARALVDLFEATQNAEHLQHALELVDEANAKLAAPGGGWRSLEGAAPTSRVELFDSEEPSGNAVMAETLVRLGALTGKSAFYDLADKTFAAYADRARESGLGMSAWLDASLVAEGPFYDVAVAGAPELADAVRAIAPSWAVVTRVPTEGPSDALRALLPPTSGKTGPAAYVCVRGACKLPAKDAATLRRQLYTGWAK